MAVQHFSWSGDANGALAVATPHTQISDVSDLLTYGRDQADVLSNNELRFLGALCVFLVIRDYTKGQREFVLESARRALDSFYPVLRNPSRDTFFQEGHDAISDYLVPYRQEPHYRVKEEAFAWLVQHGRSYFRAPGLADRYLKVNHAGEHGAICIYTAQIHVARLTAPAMVAELLEFRSHEIAHRSIFLAELQRRGRPRCRSYWLCGAGGYFLGLITAVCGRSAIAATTAAVEQVVLRHLQQQLAALGTSDPPATVAISAIVAYEQRHHDHSEALAKTGRFWPKVITPIVAASTEFVIWTGMRL